ncbi:hypothetical protein BC829DRAFT_33166 [Chytridium lagenaria]|nr:hypothetical protein BC829DRAFT_33166 [Chytridium lagenaria]
MEQDLMAYEETLVDEQMFSPRQQNWDLTTAASERPDSWIPMDHGSYPSSYPTSPFAPESRLSPYHHPNWSYTNDASYIDNVSHKGKAFGLVTPEPDDDGPSPKATFRVQRWADAPKIISNRENDHFNYSNVDLDRPIEMISVEELLMSPVFDVPERGSSKVYGTH